MDIQIVHTGTYRQGLDTVVDQFRSYPVLLATMLRAVLPGSFDPPTNGHINLINRAAQICDELHIVIACNQDKNYLFSPEERLGIMQDLLKDQTNVLVHLWDSLIVNFAKEKNLHVIIRGVRALADFSYEFELAMTNKMLHKDIEIIFLPTDPKYFVLRSSAIKEIAMFGGDITSMVPPVVAEALKGRLAGT